MSKKGDIVGEAYPEKEAGGFTSVDGTVEFYSRVNALLNPGDRILDFGAGRAAWLDSDSSPWKRRLRDLRREGRTVVAVDIDPAVLENTVADETVVIDEGEPLPFGDEEFDVILADYVFEHIADPHGVGRELARVLRPGGWICARTPNRRGYVSVATRIIPNRRHVGVLHRAQPHREARDVFPTQFKLNTFRDIQTAFPPDGFSHHSYYYEAEPSYYFGRRSLFAAMKAMNHLLPGPLRSSIFVFIRKTQST